MTTLVASNLVKQYRSRKVVDGVSFAVQTGEVVGLLGPNGAGKTTCFYMIVGLVACDGGKIFLDRKDVSNSPMHERARMGLGYLPQESSIFRRLSVADNIMAILETRPDLSDDQRINLLDELMHELHVGHLADHRGITLSGGERRRVEIARALAARPVFMLLDEPFAGVDPISVLDIHNIIAHLRDAGIGVLITDHNVREALGICDRAYIVSEGKVISEGSPDEITNDSRVREVYLGEHFTL
ncbi:MAG: LPS export ABC transporter ATP-binding protein [Gammaproteobacteria bacterium]|nr:MAG: LPS export ABC transporter ATP-binding protein [Gammaproteobacteria bacterium]